MSKAGISSVEANRQYFNIDWRVKRPVFDEQMAYFCMKEEMADVEFVFNRNNKITKISAHRFALAIASEVFQKELTYCAENNSEKRTKILQIIKVTDKNVDIDAFVTTLRFIYNGYKNVELTGDSALAVLYIAMKYLIRPLESICIDYLVDNLNAENALTIIQFCIDCDTDSRLLDGCLGFIQGKTESVLKAESFSKISHECLILLLKQKALNIAEVRLFEAVVSWAKFNCSKFGEDPTDGEKLRSRLGTAMLFIRFATMSVKEFAEFVAPTGILNSDEQLNLVYTIAGANPLGSPIFTIATPRIRNKCLISLDVLKRSSFAQNKLSLLARISNFPSFVALKEQNYSRLVNVDISQWQVSTHLQKYCQTTQKYISITPASTEQPETLAVYIHGGIGIHEDHSFDVTAKIKLKRPSTATQHEFSHKFCFNASNGFAHALGFPNIARIDAILNPQNGHLIEDSLELLVDVTITECANE